MTPLERVTGPAGATFSNAVVASGTGRWVYVAGQLPVGPDGELVEGDAAAQAKACFDSVERVLRSCAASLDDVVRITGYLVNLDDYEVYNRVRGERFGQSRPASTAVQVVGLVGGARMEVDAVAFIPQSH